jgi:predicted O-methyltransferase YrrM
MNNKGYQDCEDWLNNIAAFDDMTCRTPEYYQCYMEKREIAMNFASNAKVIAEIGVRAGYSAHAFLSGVKSPKAYVGYDLFKEYSGWKRGKENVEMIIRRDFPEVFTCIVQSDSTKVDFIGLNDVDLFHVDGDHTFAGCYRDMSIVWPIVAKGGVMLVDDYDHVAEVKTAIDKFVNERRTEMSLCAYKKTLRGDMIMIKN